MRMNPSTPLLLGMILPSWKSHCGIDSCGIDAPLSIRNGMDVKSSNNREFSRRLNRDESAIPRNVHDSR